MIAHAYATQFGSSTASVTWGECPLPGTTAYEQNKGTPALFHFNFHSILDLPEALTAGRESIYLKHFYDKLTYNPHAITDVDLHRYVTQFSQAGAMRCGFNLYRTFEQDAEQNRRCREKDGKCKVPCMVLSGGKSMLKEFARAMADEMYEGAEVAEVDDAAHWIAEENPEGFVKKVLEFVEKK